MTSLVYLIHLLFVCSDLIVDCSFFLATNGSVNSLSKYMYNHENVSIIAFFGFI